MAFALALNLICAPARGMDAHTHVHHLVRRFGFSASPQEITRIENAGAGAWLNAQLQMNGPEDPALREHLEPVPKRTDAKGEVQDYAVYQRRLIEREIYSKWQVREKLTLHWLEHFSVGVSKVGDWPMMARYEETLRTNALGNFEQLLVQVAKQPAMLMWLDNNDNDGSAKNPPNENFARELLQLYVMGTDKLNPDGSSAHSPAYSQADVREVARALTGWEVDCNEDAKVKNPNTRCAVSYHSDMHPAGTRRILGHTLQDDGSARTLDKVMRILVRDRSTPVFQARELLQRFVTETPSPGYVQRIARVWAANVDRSDQIARVITAIALDPEFDAAYRALVKEPVELYVGLLRQLPASIKTAKNDDGPVPACSEIASDGGGFLLAAGQQPYDPPSVFSFYRPGNKAALLSAQYMSARLQGLAELVSASADDAGTATAIDFDALESIVGRAEPQATAAYLLDALGDTETTGLKEAVSGYLRTSPDGDRLRGAATIIVTSPEYQVN